MGKPYLIEARTTLTEPGLSVTRIARRPRTPGNVGLSLSGGGSRAASAALGVVRALHHFDLLRHVRAISCVSGGSWFAVPFTFLPARFDEHEFLGEHVDDPGELRWREGSLAPGNFGVPLTRLGMGIPAILGAALRTRFAGVPGHRLWTRQVGEQLLGHFDLAGFDADHHPADFFTADESMANLIRMANPELAHACHLVRESEAMPRPFLIVNGAMRVQGPSGAEVLAPVQFTPYFSGIMGRQIGKLAGLEVGGGGISSFAFGGEWLAGERERPVVQQRFPLSLSDIVGISSASYADAAGDRSIDDVVPTLPYFSPYWRRPAGTHALFADGGSLENSGIASLLAYEDIERVIASIASPRPLEWVDGEVVLERQIGALFGFREFERGRGYVRYSEPGGGNPDYGDNQIFASSQGQFETLREQMGVLHRAGEPLMVEQELELIDNPKFAVRGGRKVRVLWVLLSPARRWVDALDRRILVELGPRFPNVSTVRTRLREVDVTMLAQFTGWMMGQNRSMVQRMFFG